MAHLLGKPTKLGLVPKLKFQPAVSVIETLERHSREGALLTGIIYSEPIDVLLSKTEWDSS
jgi:hypothetical protein